MMNNSSNRKPLIIGGILIGLIIFTAVVVLVIISSQGLNRSFFTSDNTKYVLNLAADELSLEDDSLRPAHAYVVYYYSGDTITNVETYYEYKNNTEAEKAYNSYPTDSSEYRHIALSDNYIILTSKESDYNQLTTSEIKEYVNFQNSIEHVEIDSETSSSLAPDDE